MNRSTRRAILKSGVAGIVAAGSRAAASQPRVFPKAVIVNNGQVGVLSDGTFYVTAMIAVNADGVVMSGIAASFYIYSVGTVHENVPQILQTIQQASGLLLKPQELLFVGFEFLYAA